MNPLLKKTWEPHDMPMTPHLIYPVGEGCVKVKHGFGYAYEICIFFIKDKKGRWGFAEEDLDRTGEFFFKNPYEMLKLAKIWEGPLKKFNDVCKKIKNLSKLPDNDLIRLYKEFYKAYVDEYSIPLLVNTLDFYFENWLKSKVEDQNDFLALISPTKESFTQKEIKGLLSIKKDENFQKNIGRHAKKYFWLENNYDNTKILGKDYFIERYGSEEYKELEQVDKKPLMRKYGISDELIKAVEVCIYLRDERKKYNLIGNHFICLFLKEIGKRKGISLEDMKYTFPFEIENIDKQKISERKKAVLVVMRNDSDEIYTGDKAEQLHNKMYPSEMPEKEVKGRPACLGRAKGTVKVIMNEKEFHKMEENDILVTSMTRPEFVPLMKKAAAIITDEGGITCHAAIVSRELNKPCIISTRIATKFFKDGDKVEVDAEKGVIKKL